jgi:arylsulfatase A-like enzyme
MLKNGTLHIVSLVGVAVLTASAWTLSQGRPQAKSQRNVIIFIADGLRPGAVNPTDAPTLLAVRNSGVYFANSHALFPTFTTPNSSAIATGNYLGDTGDFSNTIFAGFPIFNTGNFGNAPGTATVQRRGLPSRMQTII